MTTHATSRHDATAHARSTSRIRAALALALALTALAAVVGPTGHASGATATPRAPVSHPVGASQAAKPTIVLVHGAFADSSGFASSIRALQGDGYTVLAPPNPLRGLSYDASTLSSFLGTIDGPIVLVGHSYGGAVITQAAEGNPNVKALVYLAAYALDEGESAGAANVLGGGSTDLLNHLVLRPYPGAPAGDADAYIDPAFFRQIFAADVPRDDAAVMAASQRPAALTALVSPLTGQPAWKTIPSWYVVSLEDHAIPPQAELAMAQRMGAHTIKVDSSHAVMVSHPRLVTAVIESAATHTASAKAR